jgi:dTDP-4-dehydrorhamnose 3,5-epimerase
VRFTETPIAGAFLIDIEPVEDERGFFARTYDAGEWRRRGLQPHVEQCSVSFNRRKGTLRGMHYQRSPHAETKLVRCTQGAVYDVVIDLRPSSPSFRQWFAAELTAHNHRLLYVPEGLAHGFQTLEDDSEVAYQISESWQPQAAAGVRWDDPAFAIQWPLPVTVIAERDRTFPDFSSQ